jgi:hypothetical protein
VAKILKFFDLFTVFVLLLIISNLWTFSRRTNRILFLVNTGIFITYLVQQWREWRKRL